MIATLRSGLFRVVVDDDGQDLVEYALLTAIVGIAGAVILGVLRNNMAAAYGSWIDPATPGSLQYNWEPPPPGS